MTISTKSQDTPHKATTRWLTKTTDISQNLTVGYTLPTEWTSKIKLDRLRVYFSGDNLFTWTKLKSDYIDPEQITVNSDARTYPFSKVFSFGLDITF